MSFLGLNRLNPVRSLRRKNNSRSAAPTAKTRRHNRVGAGHFALEPLEDRRMLAVLNLDVHLLADVQGTVGTALPTDTVNVGDTFYVEITALDVGGASGGITGLSLDIAWDSFGLELLNDPFDAAPFNGILTANFPLNRGGSLSPGKDSIDELAGMANPPGDGFAIGNGTAQRFALLRFRADAPVTASAFNVSLGAGGVVFANGDPLESAVIDPQTITVASATPTFSIDDVTMVEGNSGTQAYTFTVSVANLGANPVSVSYATNDGFAMAVDNDYVPTSGTLTFTPGLPGASTKTVTVTVNGDTLAEGDETFTVELSNPSANAAIGDGQGVGTITNDDAAGPASFTISDAQVTEGNSGTTNMQFTVTLFNPPATPATVQYTFAPITASPADDDYFPLNGTLTFTPGTLGATQQTFNVQINGDTKVELDEMFQVTLHSPTNADIADGEGLGTILNDDTAIVSVANVSIVEGNSGTTQAMVVVSMSSPAVLPVSVMLATSGGTATAGEDYVALSQLVTIPVNQTQVMVPITINGDATIESDETITVTITAATFGGNTDATRAAIGTATATVTITNDDSNPSVALLSIADVSVAEGDAGTSQAMVTVSLSQTVNEDVTVTLNTASGTATLADNDFVAAVNQTVTIPAGQTSAVVPITINGDAKVELDESFTVSLTNALVGGVSDPNRVAIQTPTATVTITNDDATTLSLNDVSQVEGNEDFEFTVTLSKAVDVPLTLTVRSGTTNLFDITIPAGATTHNFTVAVSNSDDNNIVEGERVATITLVNLVAQGRNVTLGDVTGEAIVLDNDTATLSINDVSQEEAVGDFVFTLTLSRPVAVDVFVSVMAPEGSDIITIPANALTQTFTVLFDDNDIVEFDGEFDIVITSIDADGLPVTIAKGTGVGEILDDDFADITISDVSIVEGNSGNTNLVFTVTLSNPVDADVVFEYATSDGTASAGSDYIAKSGTITFARPVLVTDPFVTSQTITIEIIGDTVIEPNETFTVTLSNLMAEGLENIAVFIMDGTAIGTITDDDTPVPTLSISDGTVVVEGDSGATNMVFTVTLVNPPAGEVQVNYQTVDGTASSLDLDFADTFGTLVFPQGTTTRTINVPILGDNLVELDETFTVELFAATGATIGDDDGTGTITDDDAATISIADAAAVVEGDSGTVAMTFTVSLSSEVDTDVTIAFNTANGTATGGVDFIAITGQTITFTAGGALTQNITVMVNGDETVELDEVLSVVLSNISAAGREVTFADDTASGTIVNDDALSISIGNATLVEGTGVAPTAFAFPITLSAPASQDVTVVVNTVDGSATAAGGDYTPLSNVLVTIPAGQTTVNVTVEVDADADIELDEQFGLTITDARIGGQTSPSVTIGQANATGTITNDDGITVSIADATVVEGDSGTANLVFTISLSAAVNAPVSVNVTSADVLATAGADYQGINNQTFTIPAGQTSVTVTIEVGGDNLVERDETLTLTLSNLQTTAANVTLNDAVATGTITNDDDATISVADVAANEGNSGTTNLVFTITLSAAADADITLAASTANDTATAGTDYTALVNQTVTIPAGATSATVTVSIAGDTTVEANELLDLILSNLQAGGRSVSLADGEAVGTITNDDAATISIAPATLVEGNSGTSSMMFNVTLSAAVDVPVTVTLNTADGTATVANNDYAAVSGATLTFNPGDPLTKTFAVTINGDTAVETNETFTLSMSNVQAGGRNVSLGTASATGTITNDDGPATAFLSIANATTTEGNSGTKTLSFTITLSAAVEEDVTVTVNSTNGTATAGQDYTALVNQTVTILAGQTTATVNVTLTGDNTVELDETFTLTLSNPLFDGVSNLARVALDTDNGDNVDNVATGTITNDDVGTLTIANVTQAEGTSANPTAFVLTVTMSNPADRDVTFTVNTANGTATAGTDYTAISNQTVTIAAGQTTAQVTVNVTADSTVESNETFTVAMSNPQFGGATDTARIALGGASTATVTITDDDGQSSLSGFVFVDADNDGVRDNGEIGIPGVQVTLRRTDVTGTPDVIVLTGNDGSYSFANVTPGTYSIIQAQPAAFIDGTDSVGSQGGTLGNDTISAIALAGGVTGTGNNFGERGLTPDFVSKRLYLGSTPEAATTLRELNARAAELAGNTALAQSIRNGSSTVVTATISIADATVTEGNTGTTTMTFNVTLSSPSDAPVTVTVNTANGTATTADNDYTAISNQTITFAAGVTTQTVTVTINGDNRGEANETFNVNLSNIQANGRSITFADASAVGTITNDDTPSISIADQSLVEGNSGTTNMVFTLTLSAPMDVPVTVQATTANGTATAGTDYTALTNQTVTFNAGATTATLSVPITGDTASEANETFTVTLANATATGRTVTIGDATATGTITNDDGASLSIADRTLVEGNSGTTDMVFTVTLANPPTSGNVTVQFATSGGTATANTDYTTTTGTLTFTPGTTTQTISVPIVGDTTFEPDETFTVTLSNPTNATLSDATATGTITNDDNNALLSIADQTLVEGNSGTTNMVFTVTLANPPASGNVTVQFSTTAGTASAGTDFTSTSGTLTFAQGTTTQTISVPIVGDAVPEPNETFTVTLSNPTNASLGDATATGTITNDDGTPPSLAIGDMSLVEGNSGTTNMVFTVTLTNPPSSGDVTVQFGTSNGTAAAGTDYTTTTGTLTFSPGATTQTISVPIIGDTLVEANETFSVTLTNPINATISDASAVGTITNDDAGATLAIADATLVEGDNGTANMQFTVTLANPPASGNVTVQFATAGNTATANTDYTTATGTLTFTPGTTTQTINVPIVGDATVEADETFTVTLSNATNATISDATATGTIEEDDEATISIADAAAVTEGNSGTANATFTVTLSAAVDTNVTLTVNTANGTATAGTDYTAISGQTLTFTPGGPLTQSVTVAVLGDTTDETDETFSVVLSNLSASGRDVTLLDATGVGTITDDDQAAAATLSVADASVAEGTGAGTTTLSFTITLSAVQSQDVTVTVMSAPGTATVADGDYSIISETVTILAGQTTATVSSTVGRDNKVELDETFTVTLSNPLLGGAASASLTLGDATATGTITNDDSATLSVNDVEGEEADGDQTFTITLSAPVDVPVSVNFNDELSDQTITIPAGSMTATAAAAVDDNSTVQFDFSYTVTLSNVQASGRNVTLGDATGEGTILDDDFADVQITNVSLAEGNSGGTNFTFTVTLTNPVEANVTMNFATSDGTATAGSDYVAQSGMVSFLPLTTSQTITIVVNGDTTVESNETFMVTLSALNAEGLEAAGLQAVAFEGLGSTLAATGTITNDDAGAAAALSIVAFAPTGGGLPGKTRLITSTGSSPATHESLDATAVDAAFADDNAATLSAGQVARRPTLPADEAFEESLDWLVA